MGVEMRIRGMDHAFPREATVAEVLSQLEAAGIGLDTLGVVYCPDASHERAFSPNGAMPLSEALEEMLSHALRTGHRIEFYEPPVQLFGSRNSAAQKEKPQEAK